MYAHRWLSLCRSLFLSVPSTLLRTSRLSRAGLSLGMRIYRATRFWSSSLFFYCCDSSHSSFLIPSCLHKLPSCPGERLSEQFNLYQHPFIFSVAFWGDLVRCIVVEDPRARIMFGVGRHKAMLTNLARITASAHPAHVEDIPALHKSLFGRAVWDESFHWTLHSLGRRTGRKSIL